MSGTGVGTGLLLALLLAVGIGRGKAEEVSFPEDAVPVGPSVEARIAEIHARIQEVLVYPALARKRGIEGETLVAFRIGTKQRAEGVEVQQSSGHGALDRAALEAVAAAGPLPHVFGRLEVPVRFALEP